MTSDIVRLSVNLAPDVAAALNWVAEVHGESVTDAVRRCISMQLFVTKELSEGAQLHVTRLDGTEVDVVIPT